MDISYILNKKNYIMEEFDVFLSFEGINRKKINLLTEKIKKSNIKYFFDNEEQRELWGSEVDMELNKYIEGSALFIPFITKDYNKNTWTNKEIQYARGVGRDKFIHPIIIGGTSKEYIDELLAKNGIPKIKGVLSYEELSNDVIEEISVLLLQKVTEFKKNNPVDSQTIVYDKLASKQEYEKLLIEINKLRKHDLVDNPGKLPQSVFYIELEDKLSELSQKKFNCVIIHGPQLTGKKTLVSNYISSQPKKYVIPYDGTKMDLSLTNKRSTEHIFASWLRAIYTSLVNRHKDNPAVLNVLNEYKDEIVNHRLEAYKKIADKIKMGVSAKYYTGFDILNVYFTELFREANIVVNDKTKIIIEFAIRNFQKMFTDTLYKNFMEELKKYIQSDNDKKNSFIEFIIISRYIHPSIINELGEQKIVVNTRFLKLEELGKMLSPLIVIEKITKSEDFINRFFFYTNGQPYFSIKLIYLYISVRLKDEVKLPPEELLEHIFNIEDYWIYYGNEHDNAQCSFRHNISEIKNFYKKRNKTKVDKYVEILSFLSNSDNKLNDILEEINNEESANNDFYANDILVSTGIFNYKFVGDLYEAVSFGNPIIEKHIVAELVKHYKQ